MKKPVKQKAVGQLIGPLTIETLANGGKGIAREQGRVIFVAGAFPGDVVLCRLTKEKKNYAEGEVAELQQPSPLRRTPPCPVADECGGCQWQQLPYSEQLKWKQQLFNDTLTRQAGVEPSCLLPIVPAAEELNYRSRVQVKCCRSSEGFVVGFFRPQSRSVVAIQGCPVMAPALNLILSRLHESFVDSPFASDVSQIDLSIGSDDRLRAIVHYSGRDILELTSLLRSLAEKHGFAVGIQVEHKDSLRMICGDEDLTISVDQPEIFLNYAAGGFAQINLKQNQKLVDYVVSAADLQGAERVLDLYCGMGNFSLPLARRSKFVVGVENYAQSIKMARRNAETNKINNAEFHVLPAERSFLSFREKFDLLVLDPPRAGAYSVVKLLQQKPISKIIYVSCDPQTLARDLKFLLGIGYIIISSQAYDMFPQTHHVESVTVLKYCPE